MQNVLLKIEIKSVLSLIPKLHKFLNIPAPLNI